MNPKIELAKGGRKVDGQFIPTTPEVLNTESLKTQPAFKFTPPKPSTAMQGLGGMIEASATTNKDAFAQQTQQAAEQANAARETSLDAYLKGLISTPGQAQLQSQAYSQTVDPVQQELDGINNQILQEQHGLRRRIEALDKNPQGLFGGGLEQEKLRIERESIGKQADLYVIQQGVQGRFDSAKAAADRAIDARLEQQRNVIDALKLNYEENKDLFTTAEQRSFDVSLQDRENELQTERQNLTQISDLSLSALQNGAPPTLAAQMRSAKTVEEAMRIGGQFVGLLDRQAKQATIDNAYDQIKQRAESVKEMNFANRKNALELAQQGDPMAIQSLGYDPRNIQGGAVGAQQYEIAKSDIQMGIDAASRFLGSDAGVNLTTGAFQSPLLSAAGRSIGTATAAGAVGGSVLPGAGTLGGAALGFGLGVLGTPFFYSQSKTAKDEALAAASFLINDTTFQAIRDLRAQGVTFGSMTEGERIAAGRAATELASAAIVDESGAVSGFRGSPETIRKHVQSIQRAYEGRQEYLDMQYGLDPNEREEASVIWGN
jgi:hypothetical protein